MLALSPPLFSTSYGWPSEDLNAQNVPHLCLEANSYNSLLDFHKYDQIKKDFVRENSFSSGGAENSGTGDDMMVSKKINHNASERDRRKRVNDLYAFLRSLLPMSSDQKKKVSIPGTVSLALKYIPELQKEVENLRRKKDKLSSYSPSTSNMRQEHLDIKKRRDEDAIIKTKSSFVSSVSSVGDKEAIIQLISPTDHTSMNKENNYVSKVLEYLEHEEVELVLMNATTFKCFGEGRLLSTLHLQVLEYLEHEEVELVLMNATTFKCFGEGRLLSTLHLQVQGDYKVESEKLKEKLRAFHQ